VLFGVFFVSVGSILSNGLLYHVRGHHGQRARVHLQAKVALQSQILNVVGVRYMGVNEPDRFRMTRLKMYRPRPRFEAQHLNWSGGLLLLSPLLRRFAGVSVLPLLVLVVAVEYRKRLSALLACHGLIVVSAELLLDLLAVWISFAHSHVVVNLLAVCCKVRAKAALERVDQRCCR
jgi:hypothetical protein